MTDSSTEPGGPLAAAIIVAAGRGERAGSDGGPKQYRKVGGKPILKRSVEAFLTHPGIGPVVVVIHPDDHQLFNECIGDLAERVTTVEGGRTRQASVFAGLQALRTLAPDNVLIHDAARPFVDAALIDRTLSAVGPRQAALPAMPVSDTLKRGIDGLITQTVPREGLYAAQTPQGFPFWPIHAAHMKASHCGKSDFTDDASIAEWAKIPVKLVEGSPANTKLTWMKDIEMADRLLLTPPSFPDVRTGNGYDVHSFEPGAAVWLCGVEIPHGKKLAGHSDADVALHALTDALLATSGLGDIGTHFPPSEPQWKGVASRLFVEHAVVLVRERGGRIANADITLICEAPKVGPHRAAMTALLCEMLSVAPDRVSIKATTNEKLGFIGREEGIAAIATATVIYPGEVPA